MLITPLPDKKGIQDVQNHFQKRYNLSISEREAADILERLMRYMFLTTDLCKIKSKPTADGQKKTEALQ